MDQLPIIYNLPDDYSSIEEKSNPVVIRTYQSPHKSLRNKSIINQYMVDILISGRKNVLGIPAITEFVAGEVMLLAKGSSIISQAIPVNGEFSSVVIYFNHEVLTDFWIKYNDFYNFESQHKKEQFLVYKQDGFIHNFIDSLLLLLRQPLINTPEFKQLKLEELLLYLLKHSPEKLRSLAVATHDSEEMRIRKIAETNIGSHITVEELSFLCHMSISSFKRKFQKIYNISPQRWFLEQKLSLAAQLLKNPDEQPSLLYDKIGFSSQSNFS
ncbi:MAG TPA: AraC family transcriptional regulator, partial [Mucilaginibacter sp.]